MAEAEFQDGGRGDVDTDAVDNGSGSGHSNGHLPHPRPWPVTSVAATLAADGGSEMELRDGGDDSGHGLRLRWKERVKHFTWTWFTVSV